jgi:tetratricopeptide (TPR) repeat protein
MNCQRIENSDLTAKYVSGQLDGLEREAYEEHFFSCAQCFQDVQLQLAIRNELVQAAPLPRRKTAASRIAVWGAIAALIVLAIAIPWTRRTPPPTVAVVPPQPDRLVTLARVEAPAYQTPVLRGARERDARFSEAMKQYVQRNYPAAIEGLNAAVAADPKFADAKFFLGVCHLLQGNSSAAISQFNKTIALGDTLDLEPAHFYLAKAFLQTRDVPSAIRELEATIALGGDLEPQARQLLVQLKTLH